MKLIFFVLFMTNSLNSFCQISQSYRFHFRYRLTASKFNNMQHFYTIEYSRANFFHDHSGNPLVITGRLKCNISIDGNGNLLIDPWSRKNPNNPVAGIPVTAVPPFTMEISRRSIAEPTETWSIPYQATILGFNSISLKFRPDVTGLNADGTSTNYKGNVSANFSLGVSFGHTWGWTFFNSRSANSWSVTPSGFLSFSAIDLSTQPLSKLLPVGIKPNQVTMSPGICLILARNDIGITFAYGKDYTVGSFHEYWAYQKKKFFGIGLSAGLKL